MFQRMLVCLDGSELAEQILPFASEAAACLRSKVTLLAVVPEPVILAPGVPGIPPTPLQTGAMVEQSIRQQAETKAYLEKLARSMRSKGLSVDTVTVPGRAGEAIVSYAARNQVGIIAMTTHGRSGLRRAIFGSVADFVLRESGLPTLLKRPREAAT